MHELLVQGDPQPVAAALARPHTTFLFNGFDNPVVAEFKKRGPDRNLLSIEIADDMKDRIYLSLRTLAEAVGAAKRSNPETKFFTAFSVDQYLDLIEEAIGAKLDFPNAYHGEKGVVSKRGIISFRPLQAIYQAWRLKTLGADSVIEIGAGLGRTAYYAHKFGIKSYTIVDLPLSNVAQADFPSRTLGTDVVSVAGEVERPVHVADTDFINSFDGKVACILNADSLSEMDFEIAKGYAAFIRQHCDVFVSMNREWDGAPRVYDLLNDIPSTRYPYWMRDGYVEEVFRCSDGPIRGA